MSGPTIPRMHGSGELPRAWNLMGDAVRAALTITAAAPLSVARTATGTHLSLAGPIRRAAEISRVRVLSASATAGIADFDTLVYAVELVDENLSLPDLGADPAAANHRVIPGLVRYGEGWKVRPAREGSVGISVLFEFEDEPSRRRVIQLYDEVVAVAECP